MTKRELQAEVERLRNEVALLRAMQAAHTCPQPVFPQPWPQQGIYVGDVPPYQGWINTCAQPVVANVNMIDSTAAPLTFTRTIDTTGCAPIVGPQAMTFNVPLTPA